MDLYQTLARRLRPEDVAQVILEHIGGELSEAELRILDKAALGSRKRNPSFMTSMQEDFADAVMPYHWFDRAQELFATAPPPNAAVSSDPEHLRALIDGLSAEIGKEPGSSSFKYDRLTRQERKSAGIDISKRQYNKLFRFLKQFEDEIERYQRQLRRLDLVRIAASGLARSITRSDFDASGAAAPFVAYYVARLNRRSEFTSAGQDQAYDEIAAMLLERFKFAPNPAGWRIISRVMPDLDVVCHLSEEGKMALFADWLSLLREISGSLEECWRKGRFDRATMIVRKGDDSSTWNAAAGAWNVARNGWLAAVHALGMDDVLDLMCPGKALRLMAADVASWHGMLHSDTPVWAALPAPWEVFAGEAVCTRTDVEETCARFGVDPAATGWTSPRGERHAVPFRPTPELVHGVAVSHPELALMLRRAGWFSGKAARPLPEGVEPEVIRDASGAVLRVQASEAGNEDGGEPHV